MTQTTQTEQCELRYCKQMQTEQITVDYIDHRKQVVFRLCTEHAERLAEMAAETDGVKQLTHN